MNNPLQLLQMIRNPQQFIVGLMQNNQAMQNPMMRNAIEMYQKGDVKGLDQLCNNLCKNNRTSIDEVRKKFNL